MTRMGASRRYSSNFRERSILSISRSNSSFVRKGARRRSHSSRPGRQHAKVSCDIESRWRHERCKPFHQFHRFIDRLRRSVTPATLEFIAKPAVWQERKPLF